MNDLIIEPKDKSPGIDLSNGILLFHGRSIINDPKVFYDPVISWVKKYLGSPAEITVVTIKLEYIDSPSSIILFQIFKMLEKIKKTDMILMINWYYAYGDIEMLELGEIMQGRLEVEFDFYEFGPNDTQ